MTLARTAVRREAFVRRAPGWLKVGLLTCLETWPCGLLPGRALTAWVRVMVITSAAKRQAAMLYVCLCDFMGCSFSISSLVWVSGVRVESGRSGRVSGHRRIKESPK